ncbi:glycoprotease family-domain-containing protein [Dimargaris cristalligena]|uniref:N(6)-L-threonylcarbamoyladenine synthase n=1 Tax=Dimargaris cristalligena TaxID=215637 RepID=A0A4P9ZTL4_9FUNG|nr:glycoprotease family-domain-containing protein [Dimargaris cristalligena]|eukprot:RKP36863.1 glycoprotease family-domain-containing protein [Dimargaris cristalligena]
MPGECGYPSAVENGPANSQPPKSAGAPTVVLGIETSCDDTAAAIIDSHGRILSEVARGQAASHEPKGGIVPVLAVAKHVENMPYVVKEALDQSGLTMADIDAVAVTRGPGISACLSVGFNAAKTLAAVHNKPLIGAHHMEAHALTARLCFPDQIEFPFLSLLISGGHTLLLAVHGVGQYTQLGTTRDDSIGDAFDKVARALQLPWKSGPGGGAGAALEQAAQRGELYESPVAISEESPRSRPSLKIPLRVPMSVNHQVASLDFSFSGLKADVFRRIEAELASHYGQFVFDMAAAFQYTATRHLLQKVKLGLRYCQTELGMAQPRALVCSGGVASNTYIRGQLQDWAAAEKGGGGIPLFCPPPRLCTDNGVMVAWAGYERLRANMVDSYDIGVMPKWPLEDLKNWPNIKPYFR